MEKALFDELTESIQQMGAIRRGEMEPARVTRHEEPDVQAIRKGLGLSQEKFATLLGISVGTLRNWEQGHRHPQGPARTLLRVAEVHPEAVLEAVCR